MSERAEPWWYNWTDKTCTNCGKGIFKHDEQIEKYGILKCTVCGFTKVRYPEQDAARERYERSKQEEREK